MTLLLALFSVSHAAMDKPVRVAKALVHPTDVTVQRVKTAKVLAVHYSLLREAMFLLSGDRSLLGHQSLLLEMR